MGRPSLGLLARVSLPIARCDASGETRPRIRESRQGHLRAWLLLASASTLFTCSIAQVASRVLDTETRRESFTRSEETRCIEAIGLASLGGMGVPTARYFEAAKQDREVP
jgi:hypothetical protein